MSNNSNKLKTNDDYIYNNRGNIRTNCNLEKICFTNKGFISFVANVEYKNSVTEKWSNQGLRWLINEENITAVIDNGFKESPFIYQ